LFNPTLQHALQISRAGGARDAMLLDHARTTLRERERTRVAIASRSRS
jgi:cob(I)alamin adenosyltransferase